MIREHSPAPTFFRRKLFRPEWSRLSQALDPRSDLRHAKPSTVDLANEASPISALYILVPVSFQGKPVNGTDSIPVLNAAAILFYMLIKDIISILRYSFISVYPPPTPPRRDPITWPHFSYSPFEGGQGDVKCNSFNHFPVMQFPLQGGKIAKPHLVSFRS